MKVSSEKRCENMSRIGNPEWNEVPVWDDDYQSDDDEFSPLDDDYVQEEYRDDI